MIQDRGPGDETSIESPNVDTSARYVDAVDRQFERRQREQAQAQSDQAAGMKPALTVEPTTFRSPRVVGNDASPFAHFADREDRRAAAQAWRS